MKVQKYSEGKNYKVVAFLVSCFAGDETVRLMRYAQKVSKEYKCKLVFFSTISDFYYNDVNDAGEKKIFDAVSVEKFDAIVLMSESFKMDEDMKKMVERAVAADVPVLAVDKRMENCINLRYDYGDSFRDVVRHMIEYHGYRDVNFMGGIKGNAYSDERERAYREVLEENGIPFETDRVYYGGFWDEPTNEAMKAMMNGPRPMPRAIICANDSMAITVSTFLKQQGYKVPEEVAVSGFDGIILERYHRPRLTTSITNYEGLMREVFDIIQKETPKEKLADPVVVYNKMQIGSSCGCNELTPLDPGLEMTNLKNQFYLELRFHEAMNQMVSNQSDEENWYKTIEAAPPYMYLMEYKRMWICLNAEFHHYLTSLNYHKKRKNGGNVFSDRMAVSYFDSKDMNVEHTFIDFGDIIPDLAQRLEEEEELLVAPLHLKGNVVGYSVAQFDCEVFRYNMYSSFVINCRYLLEAQQNKRKLLDVYMKDSLSGLYNRNGFYDVIRKIMERDSELDLAMISIDMDHLKMINDTYGHGEGDVALRQLAKVMSDFLRDDELCARIGGDEFLIAFSGEEVEDRAESIKQEIIMALKEYNASSGKPYPLQVSIGVYSNRIKGHSLDHFLKKADDLMYANKYLHRKESGVI
ncbi:MAG: GGDEF domain-containing protein [Lachnospiraceae bacterium]|nr:GGDEF domain-containing protein [Lachnospiraceae bacterium]